MFAEIERTFVSGDLEGARGHAAAALEGIGGDGIWTSTYRVELARIYLYQGRSRDALRLLTTPAAEGAPKLVCVRWHTVRALALDGTGDIPGAEHEMSEAKRIAASGPAALAGEVASSYGSLKRDEAHYEEANANFREALESARSDSDRFLEAQTLLNLGTVALQGEHAEEALHRLAEAREAAEAIGARLQLEKITGNTGFALYDLGDFLTAKQKFEEAEKQAKELGAPKDRIRWLTNEGLSAERLGDREQALQAYRSALRKAESLGSDEAMSDSHSALGLLLLDTDPQQAVYHIRETARIALKRHHLQDQQNAELLEGMFLSRTGQLAEAARRLRVLDEDLTLVPSLRWQTEQELARVSLRIGQEGMAEGWFRRAIGTFHQQRLSLEDIESTLPFLENGTDLYSDYVRFLVDRGRTDEALTVVDQSRAEALRGLPGQGEGSTTGTGREDGRMPGNRGGSERMVEARPAAAGTGAAARRRLAAGLHGAILVYYVLPRESYLWVTTAERSAFFRVAGGAELRPLIEAHARAILGAKDMLAETQPTGRVLFDKLVGPAAGMLHPGGRVFLVGDGALNELNFETLVNPSGGPHFWIEDVVLTHVPSLRLMRPEKGAAHGIAAGGKMLLMGDPQYRPEAYQALPKAAEEVRNVMQHFAPESRTVLTGGQATPGAYRKERLGEFRYIHFVAHSTANTLRPLDSAVILSQNGDGTDKLYARDIVGSRLRAELVTISGCYSSGARVYAGEGAVGLAWAFERAGARNVIGALWEVNDASTPALMDRMYAGLLRGAPPDVALREAKLELLHSPGVFRKALYWAPFQLYSSS